jgi:hypothetical protein
MTADLDRFSPVVGLVWGGLFLSESMEELFELNRLKASSRSSWNRFLMPPTLMLGSERISSSSPVGEGAKSARERKCGRSLICWSWRDFIVWLTFPVRKNQWQRQILRQCVAVLIAVSLPAIRSCDIKVHLFIKIYRYFSSRIILGPRSRRRKRKKSLVSSFFFFCYST